MNHWRNPHEVGRKQRYACLTITGLFFHWLCSPLGRWPLIFSFIIILQTEGLLGRVFSPSQDLYLSTGQHKYRINTYTYPTSTPYIGFDPPTPASEWGENSTCLRTRDHCDRLFTGLYCIISQKTDVFFSLLGSIYWNSSLCTFVPTN
jgi:hypothetical protein